MRYVALGFVSLALASPVFAQQEVLWSNPSGGSFGLGSNWQGGSMPTSTQRGVFTLNSTYTVTGSGPYQLIGLRFVGGNVTLNVPGGFKIWEAIIGSATGPRTTFNLQSQFDRYDNSLGLQSVTARNAVVRGSNLFSEITNLLVADNSDVLIQTGFQTFGGVAVDSTSRLEISGVNGNANQFSSSGRLVLTNASLSLNSFSLSGNATVTNTGVAADGVSITGGNHMFTNSSLHSVSGQGSISGGTISFLRIPASPAPVPTLSHISITGGAVGLAGGASVDDPWLQVTNAILTVTDGGTTRGVALNSGATLRINGRAVMNSETFGNVSVSPSSRIEVYLEGTNLPTVAPIALYYSQALAGTLIITCEGSNALTIGQQIPLFDLRPGITGQFDEVYLQDLPGGRVLQLVTTPTQILVEVVAGGDPCWTSDFNGDGDPGTDADIEAFFACLAGNCCPTCARSDFNGDGDTGTDADIEAFFRVLAGGAC